MPSKFGLVFVLLFFLFGFVTTSAFAQDVSPRTPTDDEVNAIARDMFCPVCENTPLDVCPTQACAEWRELIRLKLSEGWTEDQIKDYFVEQFGDRVLATPPARGLNWLIYIIPPLAFIAGAVIVYRSFRAWKRTTPQSQAVQALSGAPEQGDEYLARLEEELSKRQE